MMYKIFSVMCICVIMGRGSLEKWACMCVEVVLFRLHVIYHFSRCSNICFRGGR